MEDNLLTLVQSRFEIIYKGFTKKYCVLSAFYN